MKASETMLSPFHVMLFCAAVAAFSACSGNPDPSPDAGEPDGMESDVMNDIGADHGLQDAGRDPGASDTFDDGRPGDVPDAADLPLDDDPGPCDADAGTDIDLTLDSDGDGIPDWKENEIGTDPEDPDTDRDGIRDGDELAAGTDPANPADAAAWHPELTGHPRLFFDAADIPELAARMQDTTGASATIGARIRSQAAAALPVHPAGGFDIYVDRTRGQIAENAAFLALLEGDQAMLDRAVAAVSEGYVDPRSAGLSMDCDWDLTGAESLAAFCSAWDLMAGNPAMTAEDYTVVRTALETRIDDFRYMVHEGSLLPMMLFARNNHVIKVWAALGFCAMSLNDRATAAADLSEAMTGIDFVFNHVQLTPDGGVAEGYHYLTYGSDTYLPLFWAWHRWAGGASTPFMAVPALQEDNPDAGSVVAVKDFATNPTTRAAYRLSMESAQPNGLCVPADDSNGAGQHGAVLAAMFDDPDFLWQWFHESVGLDSDPLHVLSLVALDGTPAPAEPSADLDFMRYDAGMAVMRESWSEDALYLYLSGEHGPVRKNGLGHEHPDELSFLIWDSGRPLIIDPGYINYENHSLVFRPSDHNTILVDGVGSHFDNMSEMGLNVGNDAFLSCIDGSGDFTWTAVSTSYADAAIERHVVRARQDYFIIADLIESAEPHQYTFLLNGMGGGTTPDSSFQTTDHGAIWTSGGAAVEAHVLPLATTSVISSAEEEHNAPQWGQWETHERLAVDATMQPGKAGFLTVITTAPSPDALPVVDTFTTYDGFAMLRVGQTGRDDEWVVLTTDFQSLVPEIGPATYFTEGVNVFEKDFTTNGVKVLALAPLESTAGDPTCPEAEVTLK